MDSVGQTLRGEREKQKRSLSEIATLTCISSMYLNAIEADRLENLPGFFFYKSFVRQYASTLGMDYGALEAAVLRMKPQDEPEPLTALVENYQPPKVKTVWANPLTRYGSTLSGLIIVGVVAVSAGYAWWRHPVPARATAQPVAVSAPVVEAARAEDPVPAVEPPAGRHSVNLAATETTWVSLRSEGKTVFRGMLGPSESRVIEIAETASLTTGNAAGLEVHYNGKALGPIGSRGQVRTILFSQGIAQILPGSRL